MKDVERLSVFIITSRQAHDLNTLHTVGAGSFVETAADYTDFAPAILRKLVREITPPVTEYKPPAGKRSRYACAACIRHSNGGQVGNCHTRVFDA